MEIIRTSRYLPAKSRPRNNRVSIEKTLLRDHIGEEPIKIAKLIFDSDNIDLDELTSQLEEAGDNLEVDPTLDNFNCFKDSIGKFARKATSIAYCMDKILSSWRRPLVVTCVIDERTDYLYHNTMYAQQLNIKIASEVNDIRGMILSSCI